MNEPKSKLAFLKDKKDKVFESIINEKEVNDIAQNPSIVKQVKDSSSNKKKNKTSNNKREVDKVNSKIDVSGPLINEAMELLVKKIKDSADPKILGRHPKYKGIRYKRSYHVEEDVYKWLINVNLKKHIDMTHIVNQSLREYLEKEHSDCIPNEDEL